VLGWLTLKPAETLTAEEREQVLSTFFDAHWHNQIFPHPRYKELFVQRRENHSFTVQDLRDLQMWFNLARFGQEFREGKVRLATGEVTSVRRFVEQGRDFSPADIEAMVAEQYKIMRAVVPIHRQLQERGQIEVSTTPFYHPILPLLVDTDRATIDRPGTTHPRRFAHPEDAEAQVRLAVECYQRCFGRPPRGMWPAEGAVSQFVVPSFARHKVHWIATDQGVLTRLGRWGYDWTTQALYMTEGSVLGAAECWRHLWRVCPPGGNRLPSKLVPRAFWPGGRYGRRPCPLPMGPSGVAGWRQWQPSVCAAWPTSLVSTAGRGGGSGRHRQPSWRTSKKASTPITNITNYRRR